MSQTDRPEGDRGGGRRGGRASPPRAAKPGQGGLDPTFAALRDALSGGAPSRAGAGTARPVAGAGTIRKLPPAVPAVRRRDLAEPAARVHPLDHAQEVLLAGVILFGPATWGVVEAWSFEVVQAIAALMVVLLLVRMLLQRDVQPVVTWAYIPVVLMLAWIALQLLPLPRGLIELVSPRTASIWSAAPGPGGWMPLSLYPLGTQRMFALLLVGACIFIVVANVYRTRAQARRLLAWVVVVGAAVAALGITQSFVGGDQVYWFVPPTHGNSGPFMNHNHYAQYLNLVIAAALGLLLIPDPQGRHPRRAIERAVLIGFILVAAVGVALSTSRGGFGAMVVAAAVGAVAIRGAWRDGGFGPFVLLAGGGLVTGAALYFGGGAVTRILGSSLASISESERMTIWGGAWRTFEKFPLTGAGLNTFEFVYPMSAEFTRHRITHADNDYLQLLAECGLVGAAIVAAFVILLALQVWRVYRATADRSAALPWVAQALALGILAAVLQGATDFAQRLPGIAVLTATYCGIIIAAASTSARPPARSDATAGPGPSAQRLRFGFMAGLIIAFGLLAWTLTTADRDRRAESAWNIAWVRWEELGTQQWHGINAQYAAMIAPAVESVRIQPRDMRRQYWLAVFRWRSISRVTDERGYVVTTPRTREIARRIADDFLYATTLCPSAARNWLMAARIELLVLNDPAGREHARRAELLDPVGSATDHLLENSDDP